MKDVIPFETEILYNDQNVFIKGYGVVNKNCEISNALQLKIKKSKMCKWKYALQYILNNKKQYLSDAENYSEHDVAACHNEQCQLIEDYDIEENLFAYLKANGMIRYSNDMAYLYGFEDKQGFDSEPNYYGVGSPFKWAKKKGPILSRQRKGQFN